MYKRLCLLLGRETVSGGAGEGGAGVFRPSIPKVVKLEVVTMGRKVKAHICGAKDAKLYVREFPAVGPAR